MTHRLHRPFLAALMACLFFAHHAFADAVSHVTTGATPAWLQHFPASAAAKPSGREISNGYYYSLFEEQENVEIHTVYKHWITEIVNESGVQNNSQLTFSFSADFQQLVFHKIAIWRDGKELNRLDRSKIKVVQEEDDLDRNLYNGLYKALLILEDIRKGDRIEIAYSLVGENPIYAEKYDSHISFVSMTPIMSETHCLITSPARKLQFRYHNNAAKPEVVTRNGQKIYQWVNMNIPAYSYGGNTPDWYIDYPYVEVSEFTGWEEVSTWAEKIFGHYRFTLPASLLQRVAAWKNRSAGDPLLFAEMATRFVQDEIRYQGVEIGVNTYQPHTPDEVYNKRYGDCKDKSLLLACILRTQGIQAHVALVNTDWKEHTADRLPASGIFDHAIVRAVINGKPVWIDPTITRQRGRITDNSPGYGCGLIVAAGAKKPEQMPPANSGNIALTETFFIPAAQVKKEVRLEVNTLYENTSADDFRYTLAGSSLKDLEHDYEEFYNRLYNKSSVSKNIEITDDSTGNHIRTKESYNIKEFWQQKDDGNKYFEVYAKSVYDRLANPDNVRDDQPMVLTYPVNLTQSVVLKLPDAWGVENEPFEIKNDYYFFSFKPQVDGTTTTLEYKLQTFQDHIPADYVTQYKKDYETIKNSLSFTFSHDFGIVADTDRTGTETNWVMLFFSIATIAFGVRSVRTLNRRHGPDPVHERPGGAPEGWIAAFGIMLIVKWLFYLPALASDNFYSSEKWTLLTGRGNTLLQLWMLLQVIMRLYLIVWLSAVIYWYFGRRDIMPEMFLRLGTTEVVFFGLNIIFILLLRAKFANYFPGALQRANYDLLHSLVFTIGWMIAIKRSERISRLFNKKYRRQSKPVAPVPEEPAI